METAQRLVATRRGTILLSVIAAAVAGGLILVYVSRYRDSVKNSGQPVTVLVARGPIASGTAGNVIAAKGLYTAQTLRQSQVLNGAISDPSSLRGEVATHDILQGSQLTSADFAAQSTNLAATLTGDQRIVSIPSMPASASRRWGRTVCRRVAEASPSSGGSSRTCRSWPSAARRPAPSRPRARICRSR